MRKTYRNSLLLWQPVLLVSKIWQFFRPVRLLSGPLDRLETSGWRGQRQMLLVHWKYHLQMWRQGTGKIRIRTTVSDGNLMKMTEWVTKPPETSPKSEFWPFSTKIESLVKNKYNSFSWPRNLNNTSNIRFLTAFSTWRPLIPWSIFPAGVPQW